MANLKILLDLPSLKSESSKRLIEYKKNSYFELFSFTPSPEYNQIIFNENKTNGTHVIILERKGFHAQSILEMERIGFHWLLEDIKRISQSYDIKYDDLFIAYILEVLCKYPKSKTILVTERKKLLNKENQAKNGFPKLPEFSIFHPDEAIIYMDLFLKKQKEYRFSPISTANKGLWYLYSLKTKVPNYQLAWSVVVSLNATDKKTDPYFYIMVSLQDRLIEMLMAIDEIGISYYEGSNNDTLDTLIYHFNYWVCLYSGVIDSLALITKHRYEIAVSNEVDIRLHSTQDNAFLKDLALKNPSIISFIKANLKVIYLVSGARDSIMHRERLRRVRYVNKSRQLRINTIKIPEDIYKNIQAFTKAGINPILGENTRLSDSYLIEPYTFVKKATPFLFNFVNEYLQLLNFDEYVRRDSKVKKLVDEGINSQFKKDLEVFKKYSLGY